MNKKKGIIISVSEDDAHLDGAWVTIGDEAAMRGVLKADGSVKFPNTALAIKAAEAIRDAVEYVADPETTKVEISVTAHNHYSLPLEQFRKYHLV